MKNQMMLFLGLISMMETQGQVLLTEILAHPNTADNAYEFVELQNTSDSTIILDGWSFADLKTSSLLPNYALKPRETIVLNKEHIDSNHIALLRWPALNNDGDHLFLINTLGDTIDQVHYSPDHWPEQPNGMALHRKFNSPCDGPNAWLVKSPTPGSGHTLSQFQPSELNISTFLDSLFYIYYPIGAIPANSTLTQFWFNSHQKTPSFDSFWANSFIFSLNATSGIDSILTAQCPNTDFFINPLIWGEKLSNPLHFFINEVLFDPFHHENDFVELSVEVQNTALLYDLRLECSSNNQITTIDLIDNPVIVHMDSIILVDDRLPNLPNGGGKIKLWVNEMATDSMVYKSSMHHPGLDDTEGVSLQRVSSQIDGYNPQNWTSSSASYGYSTPGWNPISIVEQPQAPIDLSRHWLTPNADGSEDYLEIYLNLGAANWMVTAEITDPNGLQKTTLAAGLPVAPQDIIRWDGTDANGSKIAINNYLLNVIATHPSQKTIKRRFVVAVLD